MKMVDYHCKDCGFQETKIYEIFEDTKSILEHMCPQCGGILRRWQAFDNRQIEEISDLR